MQNQEISQQELIEIDDTKVEPELQNQGVDLMPSTQQVIIQSPPPLAVELAPYKEGEVVPLYNYLVMETYNLSYHEH